MLKTPKKNFGFLPTNGAMLGILLLVWFIVLPVFKALVEYLSGATIEDTFLVGIRVAILAICLFMIAIVPTQIKNMYKVSKRVRYIQKTLIPFLNRKYNVKLEKKNTAKILNFLTQDGLYFEKVKAPSPVIFFGWEWVEEASKEGLTPDKSLTEMVYLVHPGNNGSMEELATGTVSQEDRAVFSPQEEALPLDELEDGIHTMMAKILHSLPPGSSYLKSASPEKEDFEGISNDLKVVVEPSGDITYSANSLKSLQESILFNVKMLGNSLLIVIVETLDGKSYACAQLVTSNGYVEVSTEELKELMNADGETPFIFVKSIKEIH